MKFFRPLLLALLAMSAFPLNAENQPNSEPAAESDRGDWDGNRGHDRHHDDCDDRCHLKGTYAYEWNGFFGPAFPATIALNEAGSLSFDGKGNGSGRGVSIIGVAAPALRRLDPVYSFTYVWISPNVVLASGTRSSANGSTNFQFAIGVGDKCEHLSLVVVPNATIVPVTDPLNPQANYNYVQISGNAGR